MNQNSQKKAKNCGEKDFYKLLNNANFGYDCRNNIGNCFFKPINDEFEKISYAKRYKRVFDTEMLAFVNCDVRERVC